MLYPLVVRLSAASSSLGDDDAVLGDAAVDTDAEYSSDGAIRLFPSVEQITRSGVHVLENGMEIVLYIGERTAVQSLKLLFGETIANGVISTEVVRVRLSVCRLCIYCSSCALKKQ